MHDPSTVMILIGSCFLAALALDWLSRKTHIPSVSLLILLGLVVGPVGFGWVTWADEWFPWVADFALVLVGFVLGSELSVERLRKHGKAVFGITVGVTIGTALAVGIGLWLLGTSWELAILMGSIAPATAPAAIAAVVSESGAKGPNTSIVLGVVALDDVVGLLLFGIALAFVGVILGDASPTHALLDPLWELGGAAAVGIALGVPGAYLTGRVHPGIPTREEALGSALLCGGIAMALGVSFLLAAVVMGAVVANLAKHHERAVREIENFEWLILVIFFVLSGASVERHELVACGAIGAGYIVLRVVGRLIGAWWGAGYVGLEKDQRRWLGVALMPQAGIALGMALIAGERFPHLREIILPTILFSTVVFELVGPIFTYRALRSLGEIPEASS